MPIFRIIGPFNSFSVLLLFLIAAAASSQEPNPRIQFSQDERQWLSEHPSVDIAFDGNFPPYSFIGNSGKLEGIAVEVFKLISEKTGIRFKVHNEHRWSALYTLAQDKKVDLVASMVHKKEREQWFSFTRPYIPKSLVMLTDEGNNTIDHKSDLQNQTVALVKQYQYVNDILNAYPSIKPYYVDTMLEGLNAVSTGKADVAITYLGAGHFYRTKYLLTNLKYAAIYDKDSSAESIAIRNDWPALRSILDKALSSIPESQFQAIRQKWLPPNYEFLLNEINLTREERDWIKDHPIIRVGVDPEFAPFEYFEQGQYRGIASDYLALLNQRLNLDMEVEPDLSWGTVVEKIKNRELDVLPAVGKTRERENYLNFTRAYLQFNRVIVMRSDAPFIMGLEDIKTLRVGVQNDSSHHGYLLENSDISPIGYSTLEQTIRALSGGHIDALVGNVASSTYWIRKLNINNVKVAAPVSTEVQELHFAVRKDWPELRTILEKGLKGISAEEKQAISEKWLHIEQARLVDYGLLWKIIFSCATILILILLWNFSLKRKIQENTNKLIQYAHYDSLTGLPNRFLIEDRLSHLIDESAEADTILAMLSIDLDDFKKINETYDHQTGDKVLLNIATRLREIIRDDYVIGRLGGDQFLAIVPSLEDASEAALTANTIIKSLANHLTVENLDISISASIGIAIYPNDGASASELIKSADTATHHAKTQGHNAYAFYTEKLQTKAVRKLKIEEQMRSALKHNEFYVVYQPKIQSSSRKVIGFEALLRWQNPALGEVFPDEFIPLAENNGLIVPIGFFVLKTALLSLANLQKRFNPNFTMAVNFSPRQFRSENLMHQLLEALQSSGIAGHHLELEITEGVLLSGDTNIGATLKNIKSLGVSLAMDDFGTGYSSMSYLRRYPFNVLKIDREFISDICTKKADKQLVLATIAMAHNMDMQVVAEGVEKEEQYQILKGCGCDIVQGWLFSKAQTEDDIVTLLIKEKAV